MDLENKIKLIVGDLQLNAMPFENYVYEVKATHQIIRKHLTEQCTMHVVMPSFFKERRQKLNLSMQDVTDQTDISKATISRIERGNDAFYKTIIALDSFYIKNGV